MKPINKMTPKDGQATEAVAVLKEISKFENISKEMNHVKDLNRELDSIFESSFDGIWLADSRGKTVKVNKANESIFDVSRRKLLDRYPAELIKQGLYSRSAIMLALEKKEVVTLESTTKAGNTVLGTSTPIFDENGKISAVLTNIRDLTQLVELRSQLEQMKGLSQLYQNELQQKQLQKHFIYRSTKMREVVAKAIRLAEVDCSVIIAGDSGVGKEMIADIIHSNSARKEGPLIKVNCGAIPDNLLESEFFGYESGAFTGANKSGKMGLFELANKGIIMLDEIGELPLNLQVKLLRAIQDRKITRLGGTQGIPVDIRIIAVTNRNLVEMVANKEFRIDLYYRLNVASISVPSLSDRREDISPLINHFLNIFNRKYSKNKIITHSLLDYLVQYNWPGNVRELENLMERLVITVPDTVLTIHDLSSDIYPQGEINKILELMPLHLAVEHTERQLIRQVYEQFKSTREMAKVLGVHQSTLIRKAAKYGIKSCKE